MYLQVHKNENFVFVCRDDKVLSLLFTDFHRPISPEARSVYSDALSFKSCTFDMHMDEDGLENNANLCDNGLGDSQQYLDVGGGDINVEGGFGNTGVGYKHIESGESNAGGGDSNKRIGDNDEGNGDNKANCDESNAGSGADNKSNARRGDNNVGKSDIKANCDESKRHAKESKSNCGGDDKDTEDSSVNWQVQLNGRYAIK